MCKLVEALLELGFIFEACLFADVVLNDLVHNLALVVVVASVLRDGADWLTQIDLVVEVFTFFKLSCLCRQSCSCVATQKLLDVHTILSQSQHVLLAA